MWYRVFALRALGLEQAQLCHPTAQSGQQQFIAHSSREQHSHGPELAVAPRVPQVGMSSQGTRDSWATGNRDGREAAMGPGEVLA